MSPRFRIDGVEHATEDLSREGRDLVALLTKAKNAYIAELKTEIIIGRTELDLGALLSDD